MVRLSTYTYFKMQNPVVKPSIYQSIIHHASPSICNARNTSSLISCHTPVHNMHAIILTKAYQVAAILLITLSTFSLNMLKSSVSKLGLSHNSGTNSVEYVRIKSSNSPDLALKSPASKISIFSYSSTIWLIFSSICSNPAFS